MARPNGRSRGRRWRGLFGASCGHSWSRPRHRRTWCRRRNTVGSGWGLSRSILAIQHCRFCIFWKQKQTRPKLGWFAFVPQRKVEFRSTPPSGFDTGYSAGFLTGKKRAVFSLLNGEKLAGFKRGFFPFLFLLHRKKASRELLLRWRPPAKLRPLVRCISTGFGGTTTFSKFEQDYFPDGSSRYREGTLWVTYHHIMALSHFRNQNLQFSRCKFASFIIAFLHEPLPVLFVSERQKVNLMKMIPDFFFHLT